MTHVHQWVKTEQRFSILTLDMDSIDENGVGQDYKLAPARKLVCECGAQRVEFLRDGAWCHAWTKKYLKGEDHGTR